MIGLFGAGVAGPDNGVRLVRLPSGEAAEIR